MQIIDVILKEDKQKLYAIGDSHANAIGSTPGFVNLSKDGRSAFDPANLAAIEQVEPGSIVVLSVGANDTYRQNKGSVVMRIEKLLNALLAKECKVFYVLFGNLDSPNTNYSSNLRDEVKSQLPQGVEVLDMGALQPNSAQSKDGIHRSDGWYASVAGKVKAGAKEVAPKPQPAVSQQPARVSQQQPATQQAPAQSGMVSPAPSAGKTKQSGKVGYNPTKNIVDESEIASYLRSKGLDNFKVAGILNNIAYETAPMWNSASYNPDDLGARSIGFFQHRAGRADALERAVPDWRTNWKGQIDFALNEPKGQEYTKWNFLNPQQASAWWTYHFEKPKGPADSAVSRAKNFRIDLKKYTA